MDYIFTVFAQIVILFVLIAVGFVLARTRLVDVDGAKQMTNILFYVVTPAVIIDAMRQAELSVRSGGLLLTGGAAAAVSFVVCIPISMLMFRKSEANRGTVLRFATVFPNAGFYSLPLVKGLCGNDGVLVCSAFIVVFNMVAFTYGISRFERGVGLKKVLLNPGTASLLIGFALLLVKEFMPASVFQPTYFLSGANPSSLLTTPLSLVAGLNTPVAMFITGIHLNNVSLKFGRADLDMFAASFMRLAVLPWAAVGICYALGIRGESLMAAAVPIFAPTAANTVMFATKYGGDANTAARMLPLTTLISGLTMPLMLGMVHLL